MQSLKWGNFMRQFFDNDIHFIDGTAVCKLDNDIRAVIEPAICDGQYEGISVKIINLNAGVLHKKIFDFNTHLESDKSSPQEGNTYYGGFKVIANCCTDGMAQWYIDIPNKQSMRTFGTLILKYCLTWI